MVYHNHTFWNSVPMMPCILSVCSSVIWNRATVLIATKVQHLSIFSTLIPYKYYITCFGCIENLYSHANKALLTQGQKEREMLCVGFAMWSLVCVFLLAAGLVIRVAALIFPRWLALPQHLHGPWPNPLAQT